MKITSIRSLEIPHKATFFASFVRVFMQQGHSNWSGVEVFTGLTTFAMP